MNKNILRKGVNSGTIMRFCAYCLHVNVNSKR